MAHRIVIVGGVAGGMSAATRARRLSESAEIVVFDRGPFVSYANCGIPYALGDIIHNDKKLILQTPKSLKERFNIDVHINSEVIAINRETKEVTVRNITGDQTQYAYDKLILAQGAEPTRLNIEGAHLPHVFTLQTIEDMEAGRTFITENKCQQAVIIGGGFIGLEVAENLHHLGLAVTIVEFMPHVFPPVDAEMAGPIHEELRRHNVHVSLNSRVEAIKQHQGSSGVIVVTENGDRFPADIVYMAVGMRPRTSLAASAGLELGKSGVAVNSDMQTSDRDIYAVGDMVETEHCVSHKPTVTALAGPANRQGRHAADHIFGHPKVYRGNVGTSICQVFDLTIASTGLSVAALRAMGRDPQYVTVHPPDHASYYPGSTPITLRVVFDGQTGLLLGAQAVGQKGVQSRIDVLAVALQANMTIQDLEHLELAYAPPYSSAKDPVNMAGFVGGDVQRGEVRTIHAEELSNMPRDWQVVDVRSLGEFAKGALPGAVNMPVDALRQTMEKLDAARKVLVYCQVGYRGYLAYRILTQTGFDAVNLDGGYKSVSQGGYMQALQRASRI